jgi:hypothetical protein
MSSGDEQEDSDDGAHREKTMRGLLLGRKRTRPLGSTDTAAFQDNSATPFNNWYHAMAF